MNDANSTTSDATADTPSHRYTSELAQVIEESWQDRWDAAGVFETPNPVGPLFTELGLPLALD